MRKIIPTLVAALLLLGACGSPDAPGGGGSGGGGSDDPISSEPSPGDDGGSGGAQRVVARPGTAGVRPISWQKAKVEDSHTLEIVYWSGVEPCNVLDHVTVAPSDDNVAVTLFEGTDPARPDAACIEIAAKKSVLVDLGESLSGRRVVDGERRLAR